MFINPEDFETWLVSEPALFQKYKQKTFKEMSKKIYLIFCNFLIRYKYYTYYILEKTCCNFFSLISYYIDIILRIYPLFFTSFFVLFLISYCFYIFFSPLFTSDSQLTPNLYNRIRKKIKKKNKNYLF